MDEPNILIKSALNDAVQHINSGMAPTEALKKVANDLDLNPNYIQRTGEALNVALHYKHFKTAADRSQDFEIADIPKAVQDVFTFTEKTAAEQTAEWFPVTETNDTVFNYNRMLSNPLYKRAFMEINDAPEKHESYPTTFRTIYEKSANYIQKLTKQAEETEVALAGAEADMNAKFSELAQSFRKAAEHRTTFEEFESQVFAKHGSASVDYLNLLHKTAASKEERGVHDANYMMFNPCKEAGLFDEFMTSAKAWLEHTKQAEEVSSNLKFEASFLQECNNLLGKAGAFKYAEEEKEETEAHEAKETAKQEKAEHIGVEEETEEEESSDPVMLEIKKKACDESYVVGGVYEKDPVLVEALEKEAFFGSITAAGAAIRAITPEIDKHVSEAFSGALNRKPVTATHNTLNNMERSLLLQELMHTDPILSRVPPLKVAKAFEQLLRLSPEVCRQKEVVRAQLRAMVSSQALSTFDADQIVRLDTSMANRHMLTQRPR